MLTVINLWSLTYRDICFMQGRISPKDMEESVTSVFVGNRILWFLALLEEYCGF